MNNKFVLLPLKSINPNVSGDCLSVALIEFESSFIELAECAQGYMVASGASTVTFPLSSVCRRLICVDEFSVDISLEGYELNSSTISALIEIMSETRASYQDASLIINASGMIGVKITEKHCSDEYACVSGPIVSLSKMVDNDYINVIELAN